MSKTITACFHPILGCLKAAEEFLGPDRKWNENNLLQQLFVDIIKNAMNDVEQIPELKRMASLSCEEINAFLKENGFDIQLPPFPTGSFGVASILDILVNWVYPGEKTTLFCSDGHPYHGAKMEDNVKFFSILDSKEIVAQLTAKTGEKLFMFMGNPPKDMLDLFAKVSLIRSKMNPNFSFTELVFPCVELDREGDISWLIGMHTTATNGLPYEIAQAIQQTKFHLDEKGAHVKSAAAETLRAMSLSKKLEINRPFYVWMEQDGLNIPFFAAYLDNDVWQQKQ